jgi:hypothetical protein
MSSRWRILARRIGARFHATLKSRISQRHARLPVLAAVVRFVWTVLFVLSFVSRSGMPAFPYEQQLFRYVWTVRFVLSFVSRSGMPAFLYEQQLFRFVWTV